jgi:hypothetical protein
LLSNSSTPDGSFVGPNVNPQFDHVADLSTSPNSHLPAGSTRFSGIFGRTPPPESLDFSLKDPLVEEVETLRREMKAVKAELEDTRHELLEANEAREASDTCAKALRDFIAETQSPVTEPEAVKLPPTPSMTAGEEANPTKPVSGWGAFRIWKMESSANPDPTITVPGGARKLWKVDTTVNPSPSVSGTASSSPSSTRATPIAAPFTTKIGGFFSSRASISSITSISSASNRPSLQPLPRQPSYNGSDTSSTQDSVVEPVSPENEVSENTVMIRGPGVPSSTDFNQVEAEHAKTMQEPVLPMLKT